MRILINFFITTIVSSLILSPVAYADGDLQQDIVVTVEEGDPAPFSGTLFSTFAAAKLLAGLELSQATCQIATERAVALNAAQMQLNIDNVQASLDACQIRYDSVVSLKDQQIDFLDTQLTKAARPRSELWFAIGIGSGIILSMTAAWSYGQISNAN